MMPAFDHWFESEKVMAIGGVVRLSAEVMAAADSNQWSRAGIIPVLPKPTAGKNRTRQSVSTYSRQPWASCTRTRSARPRVLSQNVTNVKVWLRSG